MRTDYYLNFGLPDITNSTSCTVSPNVYDAGADVLLFATTPKMKVAWKTVITADASPAILVEFVGSNNVDLDANNSPEATHNVVLGSSGWVRTTKAGVVLATGDVAEGIFAIGDQLVARRYYGILVTLAGTNPDIVAATSYAKVVMDAQSNMRGPRAAIPA